MMLFTQILVCLCLLIFCCTPIAGAPKGPPPTTCSVTILGKTGYLFCHFGVDLKETKHDFQIQRYDLDSAYEDPDRVLVCNWKYPANLTCQAKGNYVFHGDLSDKAVIQIKNFSQENEGRYSCQMIPPDAEVRSCTASLSETPSPPPAELTSRRSAEPATPSKDQLDPGEALFPVSQTSVVAITAVVAVLVGVVIGIAIRPVLSSQCMLHKKAEKKGNCHQSNEHTIYDKRKRQLQPAKDNLQHFKPRPSAPLLH